MPDETWLDAVRLILERYDESLLRPIATRLCRPRNHWPVQELIDRSLATLQNPAGTIPFETLAELWAIDRRALDVAFADEAALAPLRTSFAAAEAAAASPR